MLLIIFDAGDTSKQQISTIYVLVIMGVSKNWVIQQDFFSKREHDDNSSNFGADKHTHITYLMALVVSFVLYMLQVDHFYPHDPPNKLSTNKKHSVFVKKTYDPKKITPSCLRYDPPLPGINNCYDLLPRCLPSSLGDITTFQVNS